MLLENTIVYTTANSLQLTFYHNRSCRQLLSVVILSLALTSYNTKHEKCKSNCLQNILSCSISTRTFIYKTNSLTEYTPVLRIRLGIIYRRANCRALMLIIKHSVSNSEKPVVQARRHLTANTAHSNIKRLVIRTDMLY